MQAAARAIRWRFLPISEFGRIASQWQDLAARCTLAPFLRLELIEPLLRHFGEGGERVAIGEGDTGIAALVILKPGSRGRRDAFQPSQLPLGRLEREGWKASGGTAIHPNNVQSRFYREMLERFCNEGKGCIYRYSFAGKVVAVDLCIESTDALVVLKTTYDESIKTLTPAFLMREEAFSHICKEGRIRRIEFFGRLMDWHKRWTDNAREIYHLTNYRWNWIRRLRSRATTALAPARHASR